MPRRNAGPTPPTPPAPLYQQRTVNPNAYESSADIVARRNAENARKSPIPRQGGRDATQYFGQRPMPQMPGLPREEMRGLYPQANGGFNMPFRVYPDFGNPNAPAIPPDILDAIIAQSKGMGYEQYEQGSQGLDAIMAEEIQNMMLKEMEQMGPEYGQEYGMDGTYRPYPIGPGSRRPQKPFLGQVMDGLRGLDPYFPVPDSLKNMLPKMQY